MRARPRRRRRAARIGQSPPPPSHTASPTQSSPSAPTKARRRACRGLVDATHRTSPSNWNPRGRPARAAALDKVFGRRLGDNGRDALAPKRTVAQRRAAAVRRLAARPKARRPPSRPSTRRSPASSCHALWAFPRQADDLTDDVAQSCFPAGLKVEKGAGPAPAARPAGEPFVFVLRPGEPRTRRLYGVCAQETFGRPLRDGHAVLARCVCVPPRGGPCFWICTSRCCACRAPRGAGRRRRHAAPGAPRGLRRYQRPMPAVAGGVSLAVANEARELAVPGADDAGVLGDGWRRATPALAWTARLRGRRGRGGGERAELFRRLPAPTPAGARCRRALRARRSSSSPRLQKMRRPASTA